jgi:hypothetical protein
VLVDRGEQFADSGSESTGHATQCIQDVSYSGCLHLLLIEDVSGAAEDAQSRLGDLLNRDLSAFNDTLRKANAPTIVAQVAGRPSSQH